MTQQFSQILLNNAGGGVTIDLVGEKVNVVAGGNGGEGDVVLLDNQGKQTVDAVVFDLTRDIYWRSCPNN